MFIIPDTAPLHCIKLFCENKLTYVVQICLKDDEYLDITFWGFENITVLE